jgi:ferric-dicitrate binding protein FerR (iron transport regulator)
VCPFPNPARSVSFATWDILSAQRAHRDQPAKTRRVLQRPVPPDGQDQAGKALDSATGMVSRTGAPRRTQISRFLAAAGIALAALVIAVMPIRVRGEDLAGAAGRYQPEAGPAPSEHEGEAP